MKQLLLIIVLLVLPAPSWAQVCPGFPARGAQIIDALAPRYPGGQPGGTDDQRRELTRAIIEQLVFEFPGEGWTWKSADPGRPPSKDSIARAVSGRLCNYDWQSGATRGRQVQPGQPGDDITDQNPIAVAGVDHGVPGGGQIPTVPPTNTGGNLSGGDAAAFFDLLAEHDNAEADRAQKAEDRAERMFTNLTAQIQEVKALVLALPSTPTPVSTPPLPGLPVVSAEKGGGGIAMFLVKYVAPVIGGVLAGMQAK